jgi:capsid protein
MIKARRLPRKAAAAARETIRLSDHAQQLADASRFDRRIKSIVRATYDGAQITDRTENLWANATGRSADAEATPGVRATLRNRCRYESRNNSYCRGILDTRAMDTVGRLPRLQLLAGEPDYTDRKERDYREWAREVRLGEKLRLAMNQRGDSGEAFLEIVTDLKLRSAVKLNVVLIEADRITGQMDSFSNPLYSDGILYDENGNPVSYDVLDYHPGGGVPLTGFGSYRRVPASGMLHFFRQTRPEQRRGVPDIAPALVLFGMLRRFRLATLNAAETAAAVAWMLVSKGQQVEPVNVDPMDVIDLSMGSGVTAPRGWGIEQIDSKQPATTHVEFVRSTINEAARCVSMPLNVALCDSSRYNYASGRLDHQTYFRAIGIDRSEIGDVILSPLYRAWDREYRFTPGAAVNPQGADLPDFWEWFFDGFEHVDPGKESGADDTRLKNLTDTPQDIYARKGQDWRAGFKKIAEARALAEELGIPWPEKAAPAPVPAVVPADDGDEPAADSDKPTAE